MTTITRINNMIITRKQLKLSELTAQVFITIGEDGKITEKALAPRVGSTLRTIECKVRSLVNDGYVQLAGKQNGDRAFKLSRTGEQITKKLLSLN